MKFRRSKYRAIPTVVDGIRFASKKEAKRWSELRLLERAGKIKNLRRQVPYPLTIKTKYVADFVYEKAVSGPIYDLDETHVEDVKGYVTREFKRKAKAMREQHGIEVKVV